ncbi:class GN sortase [Shewanella youngdeokensis]|uniref:Class GN sortase n=1 Tax=Shewanella youngdeokensis TaxID=2999068 RepID=A0ABZ0K1Y8_9GAMM|nr:class GN sortase [Shewanella sp. DAU334]
MTTIKIDQAHTCCTAQALQRTAQRYHIGITVILFILGAAFLAQGGYMQAKAYFAQYLIEQAWQQTLKDQQHHKPWSWADTHPVAKLEFITVPVKNVAGEQRNLQSNSISDKAHNPTLYVLSGASGRNLAFGPAKLLSSAKVNSLGNTVIAGHRDTHFALLKGTQVGQQMILQNAAGVEVLYQVNAIQVVHESDLSVMAETGQAQLTLVTCYPFDSLVAGGPMRYVVTAVPLDKVEAI